LTNFPDATELQKHYGFIAAYFNRCWDFFEFLRIFTINKPAPDVESLVIHYSGQDLFKFMEAETRKIMGKTFFTVEKNTVIEQLLNTGYIKEVQILSADPTQIIHIHGNDAGTISIKILTGYFLSDNSLKSFYQLSKIVAVSGDNTLELAISLNALPFYCSTNWSNKRATLNALREITQSPKLDIPEAARQSFNIFFDQHSIQTRGYDDSHFPEHNRHLRLNLYETLDFPSMIDSWPKISNYIRMHYNFYDRLDGIVREGLSLDLQPRLRIPLADDVQIENNGGKKHHI
jgi:hypothetical protein